MYAYNGTLLKTNRDIILRKIDRNMNITKEDVMNKLSFIIDPVTAPHLHYSNLEHMIKILKRTVIDNTYLPFAILCSQLYDERNETEKIAICILFEEVMDQYKRYHT
uniref:Uncharacterized protein n=1 Tax=viral metagenome TaxID=1070528 RepID=A0A6C0C8Q3_9ZZZZ